MAQSQIPEQMTAILLDSYDGVSGLRVGKIPVPAPKKNEVLVKVAASPINPSDLSFIEGDYGYRKPTPVVPGLEGSGTVVQTSGGMMGNYLQGKRVACVAQQGDGVWAEYMITTTSFALPLNKSVGLEQGAMSVVNPLTAVALLSLAKKGGHKTVINTAAASVLGLMLNRLGETEGIRVINIVRREAQVELLKKQGAEIVLNSSDEDFKQQLKAACHQHKTRLAFDAIAGSMPGMLLEAMPNGSKVTVYGGLSGEASEINPGQLIFETKSIDGFWLTSWFGTQSMAQKLMGWRRAQKLMASELKTHIRARYPLEDAQKAVEDYQNQMTGGKVIFTIET